MTSPPIDCKMATAKAQLAQPEEQVSTSFSPRLFPRPQYPSAGGVLARAVFVHLRDAVLGILLVAMSAPAQDVPPLIQMSVSSGTLSSASRTDPLPRTSLE